jgi:hypothetical protein
MAFQADARCMAVAVAAAKGRVTEAEVYEAFERVYDFKQRLEADGKLTGSAERLRKFVEGEAERTRIAAAMQRRIAGLNVLIRKRLDEQVSGMLAEGVKPRQALIAVLEGTQRGVANARKSVAATRQAYFRRYTGAMLAEIHGDKPEIVGMLRDQKLDADVLTEMMELREGGQPGKTGNADAKYLAKVFAKYAELGRTDINHLGGSIGKLDGWAGVQLHDEIKLIGAGKDPWVGRMMTLLDIERTFPEGVSPAEATQILGDIYDTIITGVPNAPTAREKGQRVSPSQIAKSLGKSRVLHFKDAAATLAYREEFGYGNTISGMISHLGNMARVAANMEVLGPNPEVMFGALADSLKRRIKDDPTLSPKQKSRQTKSIDLQSGALRTALDISTGAFSRPNSAGVTFAQIGSDIRAWQSMAKLGGAVLTSFTDAFSAASAAQFRGSNYFTALAQQFGGILQGRPKGEQAEISFLIGEGFDGLIGRIVSPHAAQDGPVGMMGRAQELFFRYNGLTFWTDNMRGTAGRVIAAEMGMRAKTSYGDLPPKYRHVLSMQGIDETRWNVIRQAQTRNVNGAAYITPDRLRTLPDRAYMPLVQERIDAARKASRVDEAVSDSVRAARQSKFDEAAAGIIADGRRDVELSVLRFIADETSYGVIATDAKTQRWSVLSMSGARPGTLGGETLRFLSQFKSFPLAFTDRVMGRALFGHRKGKGARVEQFAHIGTILAGLTVAGYMSMMAKDSLRGYWPPRDPGDWRTWVAALQQGGAAGIYSDYLFSQVNRFGGGLAETLLGPTIGGAIEGANIGREAYYYGLDSVTGQDGRFSGANALSFVVGNTPFANLFYVRPALDWLFLSTLRETMSPGYLRRTEKTRAKEYGQQRLDPLGIGPTMIK